MEPHLLHTFASDFYGEELRLAVCGYLRPEAAFTTLEDLVATIHSDIATTHERLGGAAAAPTGEAAAFLLAPATAGAGAAAGEAPGAAAQGGGAL